MGSSTVPDGLPLLSRGRHRTPRRGASLTEVASLLAGEPWSDHPGCTHPLLAQLARLVNDHVSDAHRHELATLAADLADRRGDDHTWVRLPVAAAASTILDVPEPTQRILAAGLLRAEPLCIDAGPALAETLQATRASLELVPGATTWVGLLRRRSPVDLAAFAQHTAPAMVRCTVEGLVTAQHPDLDHRLRALLEVGIAACPR
ncbi:hypothetical protein [Nocardioides sp.]|uniref:hypothetical protein n=1 Tax=Nocardioides sp. TaxID=35761 RepID=UPI0025DA7F16|nr:hypothetical protein [Nocardioides sp.]